MVCRDDIVVCKVAIVIIVAAVLVACCAVGFGSRLSTVEKVGFSCCTAGAFANGIEFRSAIL